MSDDAVFDTVGVVGADFFLLLVLFVLLDTTAVAAKGAAADAVTGALVGFETSNDAILYTGGVVDAGFTSLLILFVFSDTSVAAVAAGASADEVTGALVDGEVYSDGANLGMGGVGGIDSSFHIWICLYFQIRQL
jgi:hypothetical protein